MGFFVFREGIAEEQFGKIISPDTNAVFGDVSGKTVLKIGRKIVREGILQAALEIILNRGKVVLKIMRETAQIFMNLIKVLRDLLLCQSFIFGSDKFHISVHFMHAGIRIMFVEKAVCFIFSGDVFVSFGHAVNGQIGEADIEGHEGYENPAENQAGLIWNFFNPGGDGGKENENPADSQYAPVNGVDEVNPPMKREAGFAVIPGDGPEEDLLNETADVFK